MKINPKHIDETIAKLKDLLPNDISDFKKYWRAKAQIDFRGHVAETRHGF